MSVVLIVMGLAAICGSMGLVVGYARGLVAGRIQGAAEAIHGSEDGASLGIGAGEWRPEMDGSGHHHGRTA